MRGSIAAMLVATTALGVVAGAPPSVAGTRADPPPGRYALGDSVMLGAKSRLQATGFDRVDAQVSRQAYSAPAELRRRGDALPRDVVVHLGTNGQFPLDTCTSLVKAVGPRRRLFLLTVHVPRSWEKPNNRVIRQCAAGFPAGRVTVVDWDWAASRHPSWLYSDGMHLRPAGTKAFARIIDDAIDDADRATAGAPMPSPSP